MYQKPITTIRCITVCWPSVEGAWILQWWEYIKNFQLDKWMGYATHQILGPSCARSCTYEVKTLPVSEVSNMWPTVLLHPTHWAPSRARNLGVWLVVVRACCTISNPGGHGLILVDVVSWDTAPTATCLLPPLLASCLSLCSCLACSHFCCC